MPVPPDPSDPHSRDHSRDFAAWERQLARARGRPRLALYIAVYGVVVLCGIGLILLHDPGFGIAVLVIAAVVAVLWFSEK